MQQKTVSMQESNPVGIQNNLLDFDDIVQKINASGVYFWLKILHLELMLR